MKKGEVKEGRGEDGRWRKDPCTDDNSFPHVHATVNWFYIGCTLVRMLVYFSGASEASKFVQFHHMLGIHTVS